MSSFVGDKRIVLPLVIIALGAICVPVVRVKGAIEKRAKAEGAATQEAGLAPTLPAISQEAEHVRTPTRDPFAHRSLFAPDAGGGENAFGGPGLGAFPAPPEGWLSDLTADLPDLSRRRAAGSTQKEAPTSPERFTLTAIIGGKEPLAVLRDEAGRAHIVGPGDRIGREASVRSVSDDAVTLQTGDGDIVLRLGEG